MTTISSSSAVVSISASRTRVTTSPTVAASLRAGTTRLTVSPLADFAARRSSSDRSRQELVLRVEPGVDVEGGDGGHTARLVPCRSRWFRA